MLPLAATFRTSSSRRKCKIRSYAGVYASRSCSSKNMQDSVPENVFALVMSLTDFFSIALLFAYYL